MKKPSRKRTLRQMAGHLVIESDEHQSKFELLYKSLRQAALPDGKSLLMQSDFSIGKADFFFDETIPRRQLDALGKLAEKKSKAAKSCRLPISTTMSRTLINRKSPRRPPPLWRRTNSRNSKNELMQPKVWLSRLPIQKFPAR